MKINGVEVDTVETPTFGAVNTQTGTSSQLKIKQQDGTDMTVPKGYAIEALAYGIPTDDDEYDPPENDDYIDLGNVYEKRRRAARKTQETMQKQRIAESINKSLQDTSVLDWQASKAEEKAIAQEEFIAKLEQQQEKMQHLNQLYEEGNRIVELQSKVDAMQIERDKLVAELSYLEAEIQQQERVLQEGIATVATLEQTAIAANEALEQLRAEYRAKQQEAERLAIEQNKAEQELEYLKQHNAVKTMQNNHICYIVNDKFIFEDFDIDVIEPVSYTALDTDTECHLLYNILDPLPSDNFVVGSTNDYIKARFPKSVADMTVEEIIAAPPKAKQNNTVKPPEPPQALSAENRELLDDLIATMEIALRTPISNLGTEKESETESVSHILSFGDSYYTELQRLLYGGDLAGIKAIAKAVVEPTITKANVAAKGQRKPTLFGKEMLKTKQWWKSYGIATVSVSVLLIGTITVSSVFLINTAIEDNADKQFLEEMQNAAVTTVYAPEQDLPSFMTDTEGNVLDFNITDTVGDAEIVETTSYYDMLHLDFKALKEKYPNIVAWVRIPGTSVDYAVAQTDNNDYYLNHTIDDRVSKMGSLFADTRNDLTLIPKNLLIYGHNMANGTMFGTLSHITNDDNLAEPQKQLIYVQTEHYTLAYQICTVMRVNSDEVKYNLTSLSNNDTVAFLKQLNALNITDKLNFDKSKFKATDNIITLSTCADAYGIQKYVVQGILVNSEIVE